MARRYIRDKQGRFASTGSKGGGTISAKPKNKVALSPRRLNKNEQIVRDVMTNKKLRSDRQRKAEMIKRGLSANSDFVAIAAKVRAKQGGTIR